MGVSKIVCGYDLSFIDIDIRPFKVNSDVLIENLPSWGSHHTNTTIKFIPGGNGFNLCRTLASLGNNVVYVGPTNPFYESLVQELRLPIKVKQIPGAEVNYTCILNLKHGEIQFNSIQGILTPENLSPELISLFNQSSLKPISNIALNKYSIEWISSLLLALVEPENELIYNAIISPAEKLKIVRGASFDGVMFIDPCDISGFKRKRELKKLLLTISEIEGKKFISVNEKEFEVLLALFSTTPGALFDQLQIPLIYHSANKIIFYDKNSQITIPTKTITNPKTFVGAGDCFNGGFIDRYLKGSSIEDALKAARDAATTLISTGDYPTLNQATK